MKRVFALLFAAVVLGGVWAAGSTAGPSNSSDYGSVVINNYSEKEGLAPVVFDHWLHRSFYTCRLCHVDAAFVMKAGQTGIRAADNMNGMYCGVCHNGRMKHDGHAIFAACTEDNPKNARCQRCHSLGKKVKRDYEFGAFTASFPKDAFGNGVNWEKAAEEGLVHPVDYIESISIKKPAQAIEKDFAIHPKAAGKADIIFSHRKHMNWNGCETCHPEIFAGGRRGTTKYSMEEIRKGKFCGVCHTSVAFPLENCDRCHSKRVK